jgi:hypothetical protein
MSNEDKELFLKDLCARLPYHLLGRDVFGKTREMKVIYPTGTIIAQEIDGENCSSCGFIPYLRPMSSMTDEEKEELNCLCYHNIGVQDNMLQGYLCGCEINDVIDWLNTHHFDYRGLILKGLALKAPEGMYALND